MPQVGGVGDLTKKPLVAECRGEIGTQGFERDLAIVLEVVREIDGRHATRAELALDGVTSKQRRLELIEGHAPEAEECVRRSGTAAGKGPSIVEEALQHVQ
jgi:hypothetical protein